MWTRLRSLIRTLASRGRVERELNDEMDFHIRARTEHWMRNGLAADEAKRRARVEFGALDNHKEQWREARGLRLFDELRSDLSYGWRMLRSSPTFTFVSVAILAIGIGANIAVFNVLEAVMLRRLPVQQPQDLREIAWIQRATSKWQMSYDGSQRPWEGGDRIATSFAYPPYAAMRDRATTMSDVMLFTRYDVTVGVQGRDTRLPALLVSGNFLSGLGVKPMAGRNIEPADDRPGASAVAVLTYDAWQRMFGGDPSAALGRTVAIDGAPAVIIGVTPPGFYGVEPGSPVDVLAPITTVIPVVEAGRPDALTTDRRWAFQLIGRVKPGVEDERVRSELDTIVRQSMPIDFSTGDQSALRQVVLRDGSQGLDALRRNYSEPLYLLMAIMAAILLIACANIAGLLLARAAAREREMGLRFALGAGRGRLLRQVLTESGLLAFIGGVAGVLAGLAAAERVLPLLNQEEEPIILKLGMSAGLAAFSLGLCVMVAVLSGILPAFRAARVGLIPMLKRATSSQITGSSRLFAGKTLIVLQVTLSLVLLVGAALFTRTLVNLRAVPLGFQPDHLLLFEIDARSSGYQGTRLIDFYEQLLDKVAATPGVRSAAFSRYGLLADGATRDSINIPGAPQEQKIDVYIHNISPKYFETMGIPILLGRDNAATDREQRPKVMVVNQSLAKLLPGDGNPLGRRVRYGDMEAEIVGVVADARFSTMRASAPPTVYLPFRQHDQRRMTYVMRTAGEPGLSAGPVRAAVEQFAPSVPMFQMRTQDDQINAAMRQERLFAFAASGFAGLALLLACLGLYGTLAYSVARRTTEIGVRMALGADRSSVTRMVLRESLVPVALGAGFGLIAASMATQVIQSMLFGLTRNDPATLAMATVALVGSALVAAWIPCRRASRVDPMTALRRD
jgi:predicted permease